MGSLVSVVIPTYNRAALLPEAIDSVLGQTYRDFEIIVVDDGSTDDTRRVLGKYHGGIRQLSQSNRGEGAARNAGIAAAVGDYVAFLDSDDIWLNMKLEEQMRKLHLSVGIRWVYCDAFTFDGLSGERLHNIGDAVPQPDGFIAQSLLMENFIPSPTPLVQRSLFGEVGGFANLELGADWDMWLRIAAKYPVAYVDGALGGYRIHPGMISGKRDVSATLEARLRVIRRAVEFSPETYSPWMRQANSRQYILAGREFMKRNSRKQARKMFTGAIKWHGSSAPPWLSWCSSWLGGDVYSWARARLRSNSLLDKKAAIRKGK